MQVVEFQALSRGTDVVNTAGEAFGGTLELGTSRDLAFRSILINVFGDRDGNLKLVRVWVGILGLLELLNVS